MTVNNMTGKSPYEKNYKYTVTTCERNLINKRQIVTKLTRKDLEDKYLILCDENYFLKCQNTKKDEKIKFLVAKIIRLNECKTNLRASSASVLNEMMMVLSPSDRGSDVGLDIKGMHLNRKKSKSSISLSQNGGRIKNGNSIDESKENISTDLDDNVPEKLSNHDANRIEELKQTVSVQMAENAKLIERVACLEQQLSQINLKKYIMENVAVNRYKSKVLELRQTLQKLQDKLIKLSSQKNAKIVAQQKQITELMSEMQEEKEKYFELSQRLELNKSNQRKMEMLEKEIEELKYDKKKLLEQQQRLTNIIRDATLHHEDASNDTPTTECSAESCDCDPLLGCKSAVDYHSLRDTLITLRTENAAIKVSQDEMFKKLCHLQDLNDEITIELERYRPSCSKEEHCFDDV